MYLSIFNSFPVIRTTSAKNRSFHVPQPTFLFPLETPLRLSHNMLHKWKVSSMLVKPLAACTYLSSIVFRVIYDVWYGKTRMAWLPDGEKISKISLFVLTQLTNVTDGHTDTACRHIPRLCIASRGKNGSWPS